jgi:hypothetical protein
MAEKLVGRKGRELAESSVTGKVIGSLPKSRHSRKLEAAKRTLHGKLGVEYAKFTPSHLYRLLHYFRYNWNKYSQNWEREYPHFTILIRHEPSMDMVEFWELREKN